VIMQIVEKRKKEKVNWKAVREQFQLDDAYIHLASSQFIASHPAPVRHAIERHRMGLDKNPVMYTLEHENSCMNQIRSAAAKYLNMDTPDDIAITDSTTMGLGLIYTGLRLHEGQEILMSEYDYFSHQEAIRIKAESSGATYREFPLYQNVSTVTVEEMVESVIREVKDKTRVIGLTWVFSCTGLKTPIAKIGEAIKEINRQRDEKDRIIYIVDAVHGFGIELETFQELGCDFLISGCHKWLFGPRGTGLIAGTSSAWQHVVPVIPSFTEVMDAVTHGRERPGKMDGKQMTPGGFHSMDHRWALLEAFQFAQDIGKEQIYERVHELNRYCKKGLAAMPHVTLHTPLDDDLSAGIIAFEVQGLTTVETVDKLVSKKIIATESPYRTSYARFTPGIYNTTEEIDLALEAVQSLRN
jgi:isopenicillin-N epimerase